MLRHRRCKTPAWSVFFLTGCNMENHADRASTHYGQLALMVVLSFAAMYGLMYAMVDSRSNVYTNVNQLYMAGLMAAPMAVIELVVMRGMYHRKRLNAAIIVVGIAAAASFWILIRQQTAVGDRQFLRSMIPHHAGAILMCKEAGVRDRDIQSLCAGIIQSQQSEIDQMKVMLARLR